MTDLIKSLEDWNNFKDQHGGQLKLHRDWIQLKKEIVQLETFKDNLHDIAEYLKKHGWQKLKEKINSLGPNVTLDEVLDELSNKIE